MSNVTFLKVTSMGDRGIITIPKRDSDAFPVGTTVMVKEVNEKVVGNGKQS
jgi:hypothetical protein